MRILVIEDETGIANFIKQGLEEESYAVDTVENGAAGLELAFAIQYDLLLIDSIVLFIQGIKGY